MNLGMIPVFVIRINKIEMETAWVHSLENGAEFPEGDPNDEI